MTILLFYINQANIHDDRYGIFLIQMTTKMFKSKLSSHGFITDEDIRFVQDIGTITAPHVEQYMLTFQVVKEHPLFSSWFPVAHS